MLLYYYFLEDFLGMEWKVEKDRGVVKLGFAKKPRAEHYHKAIIDVN